MTKLPEWAPGFSFLLIIRKEGKKLVWSKTIASHVRLIRASNTFCGSNRTPFLTRGGRTTADGGTLYLYTHTHTHIYIGIYNNTRPQKTNRIVYTNDTNPFVLITDSDRLSIQSYMYIYNTIPILNTYIYTHTHSHTHTYMYTYQ